MESAWHSAHVYYYDGAGTDDLLLGGVRPLLTELATLGAPRSYFVRHWLRGPHVRIHVRCDSDMWRGRVQPLIAAAMADYLRRHPSRATLDEEREQRVHATLAALESEHGTLTPWFPDNSVQYLPYDRRLHVLGSDEAADLLAAFHVETTPLVFRIVAEQPAGSPRLGAMLSLMFASAQIGCPPISRGYLSYRSHAEGFFVNCTDPDGTRSRFEDRYQANREQLAERMRAAISGIDDDAQRSTGEVADVPYLAEWSSTARRFLAQAQRLVSEGTLSLPGLHSTDGVEQRLGKGLGNVSDFHEAMYANESVLKVLSAGSWFDVYRVLLNYQYMLFSRLGLSPPNKFLLCHLAARTVEETHDVSLQTMIDLLEATPSA